MKPAAGAAAAPSRKDEKDAASRLPEPELVRLTEVLVQGGLPAAAGTGAARAAEEAALDVRGPDHCALRLSLHAAAAFVTETPGRDTWRLVSNILELYSAQPQATDEDTHAAMLMARTREIFADEPHAF